MQVMICSPTGGSSNLYTNYKPTGAKLASFGLTNREPSMKPANPHTLAINGGSSSIKFALFQRRFNEMVNLHSGLLGVSEAGSDVRDLLEHETQDVRAAEAVPLFCYQAKKWIGALAAALGGLDTRVCAAGIGENAPAVRARICAGLGFLGIQLDEKRNAANEGMIFAAASRVAVRVIHTDQECMMAKTVCSVLGLGRERAN
jgi:acetate kinase